MRLAGVAVAILAGSLACAAPTPSTDVRDTSSPVPSVPTHAALREAAATELGVEPDQLLPLEDGFVVARFRDETELELIWIGPVDGALTDRVLATVAEQPANANVSLASVHAAVCPESLGLARTRFLFGQETEVRRLLLTGPAALGGEVSGGTYVFAIDDDAASSSWTVTNESGGLLANGDASWLEGTTPPEGGGSCTVTSEH
jgi:hypothetical protein